MNVEFTKYEVDTEPPTDSGKRTCRGYVLRGGETVAYFYGYLNEGWESSVTVYTTGRTTPEEIGEIVGAVLDGIRKRGFRGEVEFSVETWFGREEAA